MRGGERREEEGGEFKNEQRDWGDRTIQRSMWRNIIVGVKKYVTDRLGCCFRTKTGVCVSKKGSYRKGVRNLKKEERKKFGGWTVPFCFFAKSVEMVRDGHDWVPLENSNSSVSQLSPLLVCLDGFTARESRRRERESEREERERVISLGFCTAAARSRVGDILEPSIVYTDHKHLGSQAE